MRSSFSAGRIGRRTALLGGAGLAAYIFVPRIAGRRALAQALIPTPMQTAGPFYPVEIPADADNNLVDVRGAAAPAEGQVTHILGRVMTVAGEPLPGAMVEIWQCDAQGIYLHPGSRRQASRDPGFQGYGRAIADADGQRAGSYKSLLKLLQENLKTQRALIGGTDAVGKPVPRDASAVIGTFWPFEFLVFAPRHPVMEHTARIMSDGILLQVGLQRNGSKHACKTPHECVIRVTGPVMYWSSLAEACMQIPVPYSQSKPTVAGLLSVSQFNMLVNGIPIACMSENH